MVRSLAGILFLVLRLDPLVVLRLGGFGLVGRAVVASSSSIGGASTSSMALIARCLLPPVEMIGEIRGFTISKSAANHLLTPHTVETGVDHPIRGWRCKGCPYMAACS